jgi:hypothetical protein
LMMASIFFMVSPQGVMVRNSLPSPIKSMCFA